MYDIPIFENYSINVKGEVYSKVSKRFLKAHLKPNDNGRLYRFYNLTSNKKLKTVKASRLMCATFLNLDLNDKNLVAEHIDNDSTNDHLSNLQVKSIYFNSIKSVKERNLGFAGVTWASDRNAYRISYMGKYIKGVFNCEISALKTLLRHIKEQNINHFIDYIEVYPEVIDFL